MSMMLEISSIGKLRLASNEVKSKFSESKLAISPDRSISYRSIPNDYNRFVSKFMSKSMLLTMSIISDNLMADKS